MEKEPILTVKDLSIAFHMYDKGLEQYDLKVISNLDLDVYPGEIVAIAGSSGSGKSLLAHAVMGLLPENALLSGTIAYKGKILDQADKEKLRGKELALVPQSVAYLDPLMRIGTQVSGKGAPKKKVTLQKKIFQRLQLKENVEKLYPFQLSGGMARRVLVSTAVLSGADVIIADEPTPGLDLEMALETLKIFRELADEGFGALEVCGAFGENLAREMYQAADRRLTVSYVVCPKDQEEASLQFWGPVKA